MIGGFFDTTKIPELRRRILFVILMLIIYRIGIFIPIPGIDVLAFKNFMEQSAAAGILGMANMFSGGALENFSIMALGIMPYISVSIIFQLLRHTVKPLEELAQEGQQGKRKISKYIRIGTVFLALFQGYVISAGLETQGGIVTTPGLAFKICTAITLCTGTMFVMWLGEQITEHGIGNGISIIIMAGIVARMPSGIGSAYILLADDDAYGKFLLLFAFGLAIVTFVVFIERSLREIPVKYPGRAVGRGQFSKSFTQHLPLKLNSSGVMPAIFASAFISLPIMFIQFLQIEALDSFMSYINHGGFFYELFFGLLIVFFCFFYTALTLDPDKLADNLKSNGAFIPTVRPGKDTSAYIGDVITKLTVWGSIYMCIVCIVPQVFYRELGAVSFSYFFGGTAVLITVGVVIDTISQIEPYLVSRNYTSLIKKGAGKMRGIGQAMPHMKGKLIQR
ncbi:MAG: preprotein translocase subunit SecY [Deltaproteobacteria bacterium]|nr:preprotein translocase subunit SecY [Deltaproteobacteria bacterium]